MGGFAIDQVLRTENVILDAPCASLEDCLTALKKCVETNDACRDAAVFLGQVRDREAVSSTATRSGAAFPHARSEAIERLLITALRPRQPLPAPPGGTPVKLIFLMGIPLDAPGEYLESMALLSRKLRDPGVLQTLTATGDAAEFVRALTD